MNTNPSTHHTLSNQPPAVTMVPLRDERGVHKKSQMIRRTSSTHSIDVDLDLDLEAQKPIKKGESMAVSSSPPSSPKRSKKGRLSSRSPFHPSVLCLAWKAMCVLSLLGQVLQFTRLIPAFPTDAIEQDAILPASQHHRSLTNVSPSWFADVFTGTKQQTQNSGEHAILVPYRNRTLHLERFRSHMIPYLSKNFPNDKFHIWVLEQGDDTLFNKGWLANVGLSQIMKATPNVECVTFHDVDLLPDTPGVPYNKCDRPIQLGSELSHFNWTVPYTNNSGAVVSMSMNHWRSINGMSNEYVGWGGEDDDIHERLRVNRLLNMSAGRIDRPPMGQGRFVTIDESEEHHARKVGRNTVRFLYNWYLLGRMQNGSQRWKHDGLSNVLYDIADSKIDPVDGVRRVMALPTSEGFRRPNEYTELDVNAAREAVTPEHNVHIGVGTKKALGLGILGGKKKKKQQQPTTSEGNETPTRGEAHEGTPGKKKTEQTATDLPRPGVIISKPLFAR